MTVPNGSSPFVTYADVQEIADPRAEMLLRLLHPADDEFIDLRALSKDRPLITRGVSARDLAEVYAFASRYSDRNIFFGVAPRLSADVRSAAGCGTLRALFVDLDFKDFAGFTDPEAEARKRLKAFPLAPSAVVNSGGGLHAYWLLTVPLDLRRDGAIAGDLLRRLAAAVGGDLKAAEVARILRLPDSRNYKYDPPRNVFVEELSQQRRYATAELEAVLLPVASARPEVTTSAPLPGSIPDGSRNKALFTEGCRLARLGWSKKEILPALKAVNEQRCKPLLPDAEVETIAGSAAKYDAAADSFPLTEAGDAEFFVTCNTDRVRFDHLRGRWLLFNGHIWGPQSDGEVARLALDAIRARQRAAVGHKDRLKWALGGESRTRQANLLALAQSIKPVADDGKGWDLDPWLLGVQNGVIDLKTGTLREGRPDDRITMCARAAFDPAATCALYDRVVRDIFNDDPELIEYFDRYVGYSLTGDCREESLALCCGGGANGKGTLMNTIGWLLGDYADDLPFSAFELHERGSIPNDVAKIVGKRFVTASETAETQRLNEARIKALTGRDPITARFLHREFFTFEPVAKFWLATNHKPEVRDDSEGFWRRLHLIPFTASFVGREDKTLKDRLREELSGILARAVRGCLAWQREGLSPPDVVRDATRAYRDGARPLARFIDECCVVQDGARVTSGVLFKAYVRWCGNSRDGRMGRNEFGAAMRALFKTDEQDSRHVTFLGVGVVDLFTEDL